ncbi:hypothetical protein [Agarivorans albus]|uniref:Uncharacterized protein n=1 Tax=Agarivorans albus MKT 106 TaxID=1331007 RepID=R9PI48_AGAAL|nr:hypothetical protein [Agarivorans albus]GAD01069.1 hypothetical protein AALB_1149 [Agarivorans albus MKT 106]
MKKLIAAAFLFSLFEGAVYAAAEINHDEMFVLNFEGPDYLRTIRYTEPFRDGDEWNMGSVVHDKTVYHNGWITVFNGELELRKQAHGRVFVYPNAEQLAAENWTISLIIQPDLSGSFIDRSGAEVYEFVGEFARLPEPQKDSSINGYSNWQLAFSIVPKRGVYSVNGEQRYEGKLVGRASWLAEWVKAGEFQFLLE